MKRFLVGLFVVGLFAPSVIADPDFSCSWSEYPSWSVFGVADEVGLINGKKGEQGSLEQKYHVDIVLHLRDYDTCITEYGAGGADFVCITNMDILSPSLSRRATAILPTSTSNGADGLIVPKSITGIDQLKGKTIHGLSKSVSQYTFDRCVENRGGNPDDYNFTNMDPGAAAIAFQQQQSSVTAIIVWNPFVIETLNKRKDSHVLLSSKEIPNEIVDMLVAGNDSLAKDGGDRAAMCLIETFYAINGRLASDKRDDTLIALGEKFANLKLSDMRQVVRDTKFYDEPEKAINLFGSDSHKLIMNRVAAYCVKREMTKEEPSIGYSDGKSVIDSKGAAVTNPNLTFDPQYITRAMKK